MNNFTVVGVESVHAGSSALATTDDEIAARLEKLKVPNSRIVFVMFLGISGETLKKNKKNKIIIVCSVCSIFFRQPILKYSLDNFVGSVLIVFFVR